MFHYSPPALCRFEIIENAAEPIVKFGKKDKKKTCLPVSIYRVYRCSAERIYSCFAQLERNATDTQIHNTKNTLPSYRVVVVAALKIAVSYQCGGASVIYLANNNQHAQPTL